MEIDDGMNETGLYIPRMYVTTGLPLVRGGLLLGREGPLPHFPPAMGVVDSSTIPVERPNAKRHMTT